MLIELAAGLCRCRYIDKTDIIEKLCDTHLQHFEMMHDATLNSSRRSLAIATRGDSAHGTKSSTVRSSDVPLTGSLVGSPPSRWSYSQDGGREMSPVALPEECYQSRILYPTAIFSSPSTGGPPVVRPHGSLRYTLDDVRGMLLELEGTGIAFAVFNTIAEREKAMCEYQLVFALPSE